MNWGRYANCCLISLSGQPNPVTPVVGTEQDWKNIYSIINELVQGCIHCTFHVLQRISVMDSCTNPLTPPGCCSWNAHVQVICTASPYLHRRLKSEFIRCCKKLFWWYRNNNSNVLHPRKQRTQMEINAICQEVTGWCTAKYMYLIFETELTIMVWRRTEKGSEVGVKGE